MDRNPYTPPSTEVVDGVRTAPRARPRAVGIALGLIGGALLMQFLVQLWDWQQAGFRFGDRLVMAQDVFWFAARAVLLLLLARGVSWARAMLLIMTLGYFAMTCYFAGFVLRQSPGYTLMLLSSPVFLGNRLLPMVMDLAALHLLYFFSGNWFRGR